MTNLKNTKTLTGSLAVALLAVTVLSFGIAPAYAAVTHLQEDEYLSYGYLEWAIKNYKNQHSDLDASFGRNTSGGTTSTSSDCSSYTNFAKLNVENNGNANKVAWQAVFQGEDPWGNDSTENYALGTQDAIYDSYENDLNDDNLPETTGTKSITASMQWCWKDALQPDASSDNVKGNILMDLWYYDAANNKAVVIDLLFDRVYNNGGSWAQDNAQTVGDTYSTPKKTTDGGVTVYHYGVVVKNSNTNADSLYSYTKNVNSYINDAFNHNYPGSDPGSRSNYDLVSVECGAEITNASSSDGGALGAEIFKCDARY